MTGYFHSRLFLVQEIWPWYFLISSFSTATSSLLLLNFGLSASKGDLT